MNADITFRAIEDADLEFLYEVYADSRAEELAVVPWTDEQKEEFLRMQFQAQHEFYKQNYLQAAFEIVLVDGEPVGRLYVERRDDEHRIMDIALLTSQRGRGIGGKIMRDLLQEAATVGKPVTIHVLKENRAFEPLLSSRFSRDWKHGSLLVDGMDSRRVTYRISPRVSRNQIMAIELSHATFANLIGETFALSRDEFPTISLELDEIVDLRKPDRKLPQQVRQDPFQLTFRGPREPLLPQGSYTLSHATLGEVQLFVVPGGPEGEHQLYNVTVN